MITTNWTGTVQLTGSGTFEQVTVQVGSVERLSGKRITLTWPAAEGLSFQVDWATNIVTGTFLPATNIIATGSIESWTDEGAADRSSATNTTYRYYRLKTWL